jgi:hypothetical protein
MRIFRLAEFEPGRSITVLSRGTVFGEVAVTYRVREAGRGGSRLVAKLLVTPPNGLLGSLPARAFLAAGDLVMMRRQLLNLAALAERETRSRAGG